MKKGRHMIRDEYYGDNYEPTPPVLETAAVFSGLDMDIHFGFGGQEAVSTAFGYTKIAFSVFA